MGMRNLTCALVLVASALAGSQVVAADAREGTADRKATIYYSAAPWDGAAYALEIPLDRTAEAPEPSIRVNIWGNPQFSGSHTFNFSGKEDAGGGASRGSGRASYQSLLNKSWPQALAGTIVFESLQAGQQVAGTYDLETVNGKKFRGRFRAAWGNQPMRMIR